MASSYTGDRDRDVSIGRALGDGFGTIGSNPLATLGIAFLFGGLPSAAMSYASQQMRPAAMQALGFGGVAAISLAIMVAGIVFSTITQGALARAAVAHAEGGRATIGESVMAGLTIVLPLFLLSLLMALGVGIGMLLLLVPGIMLYVMWSVAAPAMVIERLGVFAAFGRSRYLTKGSRWKVLGLLLLLMVFSYMLVAILGTLAIVVYGGVTEYAAASRNGFPLWYVLTSAVVQTLLAAVSGTVMAALYVELRTWKDGPATEALADIFG